jgi:signal transduction histidine kinase
VSKTIDIKKRYSRELEDIDYILRNLENGRYYEKSGAKMDGALETNIANLRKNINDLLNKIEHNQDSISEELAKVFKLIDKKPDKETIHRGSDVTDPK